MTQLSIRISQKLLNTTEITALDTQSLSQSGEITFPLALFVICPRLSGVFYP